MKLEEKYEKIFKVLNKYKKNINFDVEELHHKAKLHLFRQELREKYNIDIPLKLVTSLSYIELEEYIFILKIGKKYNRKISWPDNGKQPKNELLLKIYFPTGAYTFKYIDREDYPKKVFNFFFEELKTYKPKYVDSHNHSLYFSMDNAGKIYNKFNGILKKYRELSKQDSINRKIEILKQEIKKLEETK